MARGLHRLKALDVERAKGPDVLNDGGGLHLNVTATHTKSWFFRYYVIKGRERRMGLGPYPAVSLATAREKAAACRRQRAAGIDPLEAAEEEREHAATAMTFDACVDAFLSAHRPGWRSPKHAKQWKSTLAHYASPVIGGLDVAAVERSHILQVLEPIWSKNETARRLRGRIEAVLDYAHVKGWRSTEINPARWRGGPRFALPAARPKVRHFAAMPYAEVPAFMLELRRREGLPARALEFLILCAVRLGDIVGQGQGRTDTRPMLWADVDLNAKLWIIPTTKTGNSHRVPLSDAAVDVLVEMLPLHADGDNLPHQRAIGPVFPGLRRGQPLGASTLHRLLARMDATASLHGFRSSFRDWAAECSTYPNHVVEMALAHVIGNRVEAAYRRGDLIAQRTRLMNDWATFLATVPDTKVIALHQR
jgi:integrase